jgi:predicted transcriptional regulator
MFVAIWLTILSLHFNIQPITTQDVYQYIDYDTQIICYILENGNGISCLPLSEVNISE